MTIVVLGAGAIGSLYAAKLSGRHDVTVLARAAHAEAINRNGLRLIGREFSCCSVAAVTSIEDLPASPLFLLTTKVNDNERVANALAGRIGDGSTVLCVQNGIGGEEIVRGVLGERAVVLRAVTQFGAIFHAPGIVDYKVEGYTLVEHGPGSDAIARLLTEAGLDGRVSPDIRREVWRKLVFNCVINPITSIIGTEVGRIADSGLDSLKRLVIDECLAVARADGVAFDIDFLAALRDIFGPSRNIASMRQDLMRGKPTEIDFMNGAVVSLGRRVGIDCPANAALVVLIKSLEAASRRNRDGGLFLTSEH